MSRSRSVLIRLLHARSVMFGALTVLGWTGCGAAEVPAEPPPGARNIDVAVSQTVSLDSVPTNGTVTFTVRARNNGPGEAVDLIGADTLSSGLVYLSHTIVGKGQYDPVSRIWNIGSLSANETTTLHLLVEALSGANRTTQSNSAGVITQGTAVFDSMPSNNVTVAAIRVADPGGSPPPPPATVFETNWTAATGSTREAVTDGGRWDILACEASFANVLSVVPGAPLGFSEATNVLRVRQLGSGPCGVIQKTNAVPRSTSHWARFYFRNDESGTRNDHTFAYNNVHGGLGMQAVPFARYALDQAAGQWRPSIIFRDVYPYNRWYPPPLQAGTWYRYEYHMEFVTETTFRLWPRIYTAAGALLYDSDDFYTEQGTRTVNLTQYYGAGGMNRTVPLGVLNTESSNPDVARHLGVGNEGNSTAANTGGYWYYAKLALSTAGWIGR